MFLLSNWNDCEVYGNYLLKIIGIELEVELVVLSCWYDGPCIQGVLIKIRIKVTVVNQNLILIEILCC